MLSLYLEKKGNESSNLLELEKDDEKEFFSVLGRFFVAVTGIIIFSCAVSFLILHSF